jgi:hypothetical protein
MAIRHDYCRIKDNKKGDSLYRLATSNTTYKCPMDPVLPLSTGCDTVVMLLLLKKTSVDKGMMPQDAFDVSSSLVSSYD